MTSFFIGGALSSLVSAWLFVHTGWAGVAVIAGTLALVALLRAIMSPQDCRDGP